MSWHVSYEYIVICVYRQYPYGLKRENAKYTLLRRYTICTTRCGFVNSVFGFAARKVSRHQLYKHVNAHVYLDVLAYITLNSVQARKGIRVLREHVYGICDSAFPENNFMTTTCWCVAYWSSHVAGTRACPEAAPDCTRAFALHALRTRYAISWLHVMITSP